MLSDGNMDLSILEEFEWSNLEHAYGSAEDAPKSLKWLISNNKDDREEAIYGFLHSSACHQYTTYSSTPMVVRCVLYILAHKEFDCDELGQILGFIRACTYSAKNNQKLKEEIVLGESTYKKFSSSENSYVKEQSQKLQTFCTQYSA